MELESFVPFPRRIASNVKSGVISGNEFLLYSWLRANLKPYGVTTISLSSLKDDIFKAVSENYINKLLHSLRSKRYIYYQDRQGRRGSFEVHMGELKLPSGQIRTLDKFFTQQEVRSDEASQPEVKAQVTPNNNTPSQKLGLVKSHLTQRFSTNRQTQVRSSNNDNEKENYNNLSIEKTAFKGEAVNDYKPDSTETVRCYEIAKALGEKDMNFMLSVLREHGLGTIERAWGLYQEKAQSNKIDNPAAYFNGIVQQITKLD